MTYLNKVRCLVGWPPLGSDEEYQPLLAGIEVTLKEQPSQPGITLGLVRHQLLLLGQQVAAQL